MAKSENETIMVGLGSKRPFQRYMTLKLLIPFAKFQKKMGTHFPEWHGFQNAKIFKKFQKSPKQQANLS